MARRRATAPVIEDDAFEEVDEIEELADPEDDGLEELVEEEAPKPTKRTRAAKTAPAKAAPAKATKATRAPAAPRAESTPSSEFDSNWLAQYVSEETGIEYDGRAVRMLLRKLAKDNQLAREIGVDRGRYDFPKGVNDPTVKLVIKMVKSGEAKTVRNAGLDAVKATKATAKATPPATTPTKRTTKAAAAAAPAAAPAKATTTRRRRAAAAE